MSVSIELERFFGSRRIDLVRFAALQLRDPSLAEDVVQETLIAAMQSVDKFEGRASLRTWIYSILKRKIIDALRSRRWEISVTQLSSSDEDVDNLDKLFNERGFWATEHNPHRWTEPEESLEQQQFWLIFERCIHHLPTRMAQVFSMRELLGLETEEICNELAISTSNCLVILHRARIGLRLCLEKDWFT